MTDLPQVTRALGIQEWTEILMTIDSGRIDPDYAIPSAVWALKDHPSLAVQIGASQRWCWAGVVPGGGHATNNTNANGYQEMIQAAEWIKMVGLEDQNFITRREALQALAVAIELYGSPGSKTEPGVG